MKERTKHILSLAGVLISIAGFYASNASSFPFVQRLLSPSYFNAMQGLKTIQKEKVIKKGEPGFSALANICEARIAALNPQVPRSDIVLEKLEAKGGGMGLGVSHSKPFVDLEMTFHGQPQPLKWDLLKLTAAVERLWKEVNLSWALWLFWIGVVQTVWPLLLEAKPLKALAKADQPDARDE
jgi:hypothetical protein